MAKIFAIDDDEKILAFIKTALLREGHQVETFTHTKEVTPEKAKFADLILLDVMMPEEDGFAYCQRIRNLVDCPILFVTAKAGESELIHGLGIGGDDYIRKPFAVSELRARVAAHLRRESRGHTHVLRCGNFSLDLTGKKLFHDSTEIALTKSEYLICAHLLESAGQVFSKMQLYEAVFGYDGSSEESVIVEHIKNVRAKLKEFKEDPIETIWGIGYRWRK
ncbi:response regulator transcription factor [Candidatus Enterococcus murrayae]|uniref:Response regulator transcription factor n=1 Tax=Candidatus Enterococcus murrayae TaxID=2815321 RepID=A0ABS3HHU6_9ENTE|nr:response regulator transcription factor [Enterococcus sp. MJM16]MBO0453027.1 response regulator transcription factor [Enterococcus sp. MJM16]